MSGKMDALDILANAVTHLEQLDSSAKYHNLNDSAKPVSEHRVSCHRCGNIRRKRICCPNQQCPHIFCGRCSDKLRAEYGDSIFIDGCPVCKDLCCCTVKTVSCSRKNHCYRKCPASKVKKESPMSVTSAAAAAAVAAVAAGALQSADLAALTQHSSAELTASIAAAMETFKVNTPALDFLAAIVTTANNKASKLTKNPAAPPPPVTGPHSTPPDEHTEGAEHAGCCSGEHKHPGEDTNGSISGHNGGRGVKRPLPSSDEMPLSFSPPLKEISLGEISAQNQLHLLNAAKMLATHAAISVDQRTPLSSSLPTPDNTSSNSAAQLPPVAAPVLAAMLSYGVNAMSRSSTPAITGNAAVALSLATELRGASAVDPVAPPAAPTTGSQYSSPGPSSDTNAPDGAKSDVASVPKRTCGCGHAPGAGDAGLR